MKTTKERVGVHSFVHNISRVKGHARALRWVLKWVKNRSIIHIKQLNNKLVSVWLEHFWDMDELKTHIDSQNSPWLKLEGNHHLPFYNIFYDSPRGLHPNVILSQNSQVESPEFLKIGTFDTLDGNITYCLNLRLRWRLKQSCSLHQ